MDELLEGSEGLEDFGLESFIRKFDGIIEEYEEEWQAQI